MAGPGALYTNGDEIYVSAKNYENNSRNRSGSSFLLLAGNRPTHRSFGGYRPSEVRQVKQSNNNHGDGIPISTKTMITKIKKAACAVVATACLALALVGLVIGCLLGQPITLFPPQEDKP